MTPGEFATITVPPFADAGNVTMTVGLDDAVGDAATAANLRAGQYFVMTGDKTRYQCRSTPDTTTFEFRMGQAAAATQTKKAWAVTQPANDATLALIFSQDDAGNTAGRAAHDAAADGYVYLDTQATKVWERNGPSGTWTDAAITIVLWVSTTGSDTDPAVEQLRTIQAAVDRLAEAGDLSGWNVIVAMKPGVYTETVILKDVDGVPATLKITDEQGLTASIAAPVVQITGVTDCVRAVGLKTVWLIDHIQLATAKGHALLAKNARLRFNRCLFSVCSGAHLAAMGGGSIIFAGSSYLLNGSGSAHLMVNGSGAVIDLQAESSARPTVTITNPAGSPNFTSAFAWARASGQIFTGTGLIFTGKSFVTGRRWRAEQNSSIDSGQSGEKYLPGNAAGIAVKSGEYI